MDKERLKTEFKELIKQCKNKTVIVEGKKDRLALSKLGFKKIVILDKPLYAVVESIKSKEVLILTDLDKEGKMLYSKLKHNLQKRGVKIDNVLREFLFKTELRQVEGLTRYFR